MGPSSRYHTIRGGNSPLLESSPPDSSTTAFPKRFGISPILLALYGELQYPFRAGRGLQADELRGLLVTTNPESRGPRRAGHVRGAGQRMSEFATYSAMEL